ncbi:MAG: Holliday junction resolvase RuvX, partial [Myxococcota bacterium]|nr:Holliday junction resolvase RuvX [Myxococcota bacterium]
MSTSRWRCGRAAMSSGPSYDSETRRRGARSSDRIAGRCPLRLIHRPAVRRLGIDPGTKRVGVAIADDDDDSFAHARPTIDHVSDDATARAIAELAAAEQIGEIVVGLPIGLDGREGVSSRRARALGAAIETASGVPVVLWDERMTSKAAHRALTAANVSSRDRRGKVDRIAAALLLEAYLDAVRARRARQSERSEAGAGAEGTWEPSAEAPGPLGPERRGRG